MTLPSTASRWRKKRRKKSVAMLLSCTQTGVKEQVGQVGQQVDDREGRGEQQQHRLQHRVVTLQGRVERQRAEAGQEKII